MPPDFYTAALALENEMIDRRRDFHRHPEIGFHEFRTAGIVAQALSDLGMEVQTGVGKTGVVGLMGGDNPGPTVLMRFDMDALPVEEANQTDYVSENVGVMHACGHDGHMAVGLAVAKMFSQYRDQLNGTLKFVFQPAEEGLGGARAMLRDGVLENPAPDYALGMHLWNSKPLGWMGANPGPIMTSASIWECEVVGSGGHAAQPYETRDPMIAATQIVTALQTITSRNIDALDSVVVSVTIIEGGKAFNVIPPHVRIAGTLRAFFPEVREVAMRRLREIAKGIAQAMGCTAKVRVTRINNGIVNVKEIAEDVLQAARNMPPGVFDDVRGDMRTMASEDYGDLVRGTPSCYFFVGSANAERGLDFPHHHPRFDFDERAMVKAAALMATAAARYTLPG